MTRAISIPIIAINPTKNTLTVTAMITGVGVILSVSGDGGNGVGTVDTGSCEALLINEVATSDAGVDNICEPLLINAVATLATGDINIDIDCSEILLLNEIARPDTVGSRAWEILTDEFIGTVAGKVETMSTGLVTESCELLLLNEVATIVDLTGVNVGCCEPLVNGAGTVVVDTGSCEVLLINEVATSDAGVDNICEPLLISVVATLATGVDNICEPLLISVVATLATGVDNICEPLLINVVATLATGDINIDIDCSEILLLNEIASIEPTVVNIVCGEFCTSLVNEVASTAREVGVSLIDDTITDVSEG